MSLSLEQTVDKILMTVIDIQSDTGQLKKRVGRLENRAEQIYNRMDQFLHMVDRHEAEIAALRSAYQRLDQRLAALEIRG